MARIWDFNFVVELDGSLTDEETEELLDILEDGMEAVEDQLRQAVKQADQAWQDNSAGLAPHLKLVEIIGFR